MQITQILVFVLTLGFILLEQRITQLIVTIKIGFDRVFQWRGLPSKVDWERAVTDVEHVIHVVEHAVGRHVLLNFLPLIFSGNFHHPQHHEKGHHGDGKVGKCHFPCATVSFIVVVVLDFLDDNGVV